MLISVKMNTQTLDNVCLSSNNTDYSLNEVSANHEKPRTFRQKLVDYVSDVRDQSYEDLSLKDTEFISEVDNYILALGKTLAGKQRKNGKRVWNWKDRVHTANDLLKKIEYTFAQNTNLEMNPEIVESRAEQIKDILKLGFSGKYLNNKHKSINFLKRAENRAESLKNSIYNSYNTTLEQNFTTDFYELTQSALRRDKIRPNLLIQQQTPDLEKASDYKPDEEFVRQTKLNLLPIKMPQKQAHYEPDEEFVRQTRLNLLPIKMPQKQAHYEPEALTKKKSNLLMFIEPKKDEEVTGKNGFFRRLSEKINGFLDNLNLQPGKLAYRTFLI